MQEKTHVMMSTKQFIVKNENIEKPKMREK